jgi:putative tricarboxylic transport membrane protein
MAVTRTTVTWLVFACFAMGSVYEASKLPFGQVSAPGAGFFPVVLAALLAVISAFGFIAALRQTGERRNIDTRLVWKKISLTVTALLGFAVLFEYAGYLLTTFLFVAFQLRIVEQKGWVQAGTVALCASLVSYILFGLLLGAPLPTGFLCS